MKATRLAFQRRVVIDPFRPTIAPPAQFVLLRVSLCNIVGSLFFRVWFVLIWLSVVRGTDYM